MGDAWSLAFGRWYLGGFLVIFGALLVLRAAQFVALGRYFRRSEHTPELDAALARRAELEGISPAVWQIAGVGDLLCGFLVLFGALQGVAGYALGCCFFAATLAWTFVRLRNRGPRRAAVLAPRELRTIVPPLFVVLAAICALVPLVFAPVPIYRIAAVVVTLSTIATIVLAGFAARMPSLLAGDDLDREMLIDGRLRERRVLGLFGVAFAIPFVFLAIAAPGGDGGWLGGVAEIFVSLVWVAFYVRCIGGWVRVHWVRERR
ncbi:MAG: hypothetical protein KGN02_04500 [bacterium]|nr:hypothetical protein [bacterium]